MRSSSFAGRMLRRVAVVTSAALSVAFMVPGAAPAGAAPITIPIGQGAGGGCVAVMGYSDLPFIGPGVPTGGSIGPIRNGTANFTIDPAVPGPLPIGPAVISLTGIVTMPAFANPAKNAAVKLSVAATPSTATGYIGQARWSDSTLPAPMNKIDVSMWAPSMLTGALALKVPDWDGLGNDGVAAVILGAPVVAPPGSAVGAALVYQMADPANCTAEYVQCAILVYNELGAPCPI